MNTFLRSFLSLSGFLLLTYSGHAAPTVTIDQAAGQNDPATVSPIHFTATFSEPVTGFSGSDISFTGSTAGGTLVASVTGGPAVYDVSVSGMTTIGDVTASINAGVAVNAGNQGNEPSSSTDNTVAFFVAPPNVTIEQATGQADPTSVSPIHFTVTFSEPVTGFSGTDISFSGSTAGGTLIASLSGGPTVYDVSINGMTTSGNVIASIPVGAAVNAGNLGNEASTSIDHTVGFVATSTPPTVSIEQAAGQSDPTSASPIHFTATFSEPVSGFTSSDISLSGTAGGTLLASLTGGPTVYDVSVSGMNSSGTVSASINGGVAFNAGNLGNEASTTNDNTVQYDQLATAPTVAIEQASGQADPTSVSPIHFTATFSESVTGFSAADISFSGSTAGGTLIASINGGPTVYDVSVSGMTTSGNVIASIPAAVAFNTGNLGNEASTSNDNSVQFDQLATAPNVSIEQATGQADPTSASPIHFTATFSEPVTGFTSSDISLSGSTAGGTLLASISGGPSVYDVSISGMTTSGTVIASIPAGAAENISKLGNDASTSLDNSVFFIANRCPVAVNLTIATALGTPVNFQLQGSDPDGNPLTFSISVSALHGTAVTSTSGAATYTPQAGYSGNDLFKYKVNDGICEAEATVFLTIGVCPRAQGHWKNHASEWPSGALPMLLGTQSYTKNQLLTVYNTPIGSGQKADASLILADQLISAKLSIANGSPASAAVLDSIASADALIGNRRLPIRIKPNTPAGQRMIVLAAYLEQYCMGLMTSGCGGAARMSVHEEAPSGILLEQNFPNPFNGSTTIGYELPERAPVLLSVYDYTGKLVATLQNGIQDAGLHATEFHAENLPAGIYFCQLQSGDFRATIRLMHVK